MARKFAAVLMMLAWLCATAYIPARAEASLRLQITADSARIPVGKSVIVTAVATRLGQPVGGQELWAYVDGRQWGAQGVTDRQGRTMFILPLPWAETARIQVAPPPPDFVWPTKTFGQTADFTVGTPLPPASAHSNLISVVVKPRRFSPVVDPAHLIGVQWYPWFTRYNAHINGGRGAEGVPLLGSYASANPDVIRQQILWMDESGVNFLQVDWSNNLTSANHWADRLPGVIEMVGTTQVLLDTLAQMRREGLPTPQVQLLLGMAPPFSMTALNEEMQWVHDNFVVNPKYAGLFVTYLGKPLVTVLSVLNDAQLARQGTADTSEFTLRWEWVSVADRPGWWSWTDQYVAPTTTYYQGAAEAMTVDAGFSVGKGWTDPGSFGKRGGATWVQEFGTALTTRPRFLVLHQFNEWGEQYSTELSDEFEPAALASLGRGGTGIDGGAGPGWGFFYLNLARALVQVYHGQAPESTVLTVASPLKNSRVSGSSVPVVWQAIGKPIASYRILLDGIVQASSVRGNAYTLSGVSPGPHTVTVRANGGVTRFPLSLTTDDEPTARPGPCAVSVPFTTDPPSAR